MGKSNVARSSEMNGRVGIFGHFSKRYEIHVEKINKYENEHCSNEF